MTQLHILEDSTLTVKQCCTISAGAPSSGGSCKVKSGLSGECMPTDACSKSGGQSEAGHCPGGKDIQCCTHAANPPSDDNQESSDDDDDQDSSKDNGNCKIGNGTLGTCISTSDCSGNGGTSEAGHCPGAANIQVSHSIDLSCTFQLTRVQCCTYKSCDVAGKKGQCQSTSSCSGTSTPGHCPGPTNIQCCTP